MKKVFLFTTMVLMYSLAFSQITVTSSVTNVTCTGLGNGSATLTPVGGIAPYNYTLTAAGQINGTGIFSGLPAGIYSADISDAASAINSITFTVTEPLPVVPTVTATSASCFGLSNGMITVTSVTGGSAPYVYNLNGGAYQTSSTFLNLPTGVYIVDVREMGGCIGTQTVLINQPAQLATTISSVTNVSCFGLTDGSAHVLASGGSGAYMYQWSNGSSVPNATNLGDGIYTYTVIDANNCISSGSANITQPSQFTAMAMANNDVSCFGLSDGNASALGNGGVAGPYAYSWAPSGQNTATASNLATGIHSVTITNFNGCTATATVAIYQPTALAANISSNNAKCFGTATGSISAFGIGGTAPYTYVWPSIGSSLSTITNVWAGTYSVIVTDANGCSITKTVTVTEPPQLMATITTTNVSCAGACDGIFNISATGGTPVYSFVTNTGPCMSLNPAQCAGTQTITITDANNCIFVSGISITQPSPLTAAITSTNSNCGQANGAVCAAVTGGAGAISYQWSNGASTSCNNNVPAGAYSFTVTDLIGCSAVSSGLVNDIAGPAVSITSQTNIPCFGQNTGAAITSVTGGTSPYNYSWTSLGGSLSYISNASAGLYGLTVTDAAGCVGTASVNITQPTQLIAGIANFGNSCSSNCNGSATTFVNGGTPGYSFVWNSPGPQVVQSVNGLCPGTYTCLVTDANGCSASASVNILQQPTATISITHSNVSCGSTCNGAATASVSGGGVIVSFLWQPGLQNSALINGLCAGTYTLDATTTNGCTYTQTVTITNVSINSIPNATLSSTSYSETCLQTGDGAIDLFVTGSNTGPYTYQWSNGATTEDMMNLNSGVYSVAVFDASLNCLMLTDTVHFDNSNCGLLSGNVFIDNNSDCTKNSGDNGLYGIQVIANPGNRLAYTNYNGDYYFYNVPFGTYSLTATTNTFNMQATCGTNTLIATLSTGTPNSINQNFVRAYIPPAQPDLYVSVTNGGIVPGFVCRVNYPLHNYNTFNANGLLKVTLPTAFIPNITNVFPSTYTISGDTIIWNFTNINYVGWNVNFYVDFTTPLTTLLGSTFSTCMWAQPTVTDLNYANNTTCYSRFVTGSFDPNDKTASPAGVGPNGYITATETELTYLIRFQNTGNGPAVNIVVKDTLSPNVDINTFEMLGSSHNYNMDVMNGNVLRWKFNNIMLPDSNSYEPGSHGYIHYRIKRTNNNAPGTQIKNTAHIYFDFNAPVVTNTAINTIETITGIQSQNSSIDQWLVYPNPSSGILNMINNSITADTKLRIEVINSFGQIVYEENAIANQKTLDISKLSNGVYFVKIISDKQSSIKRVVLSK
ncbi:MAG: T9SS type A sorting domain-containing protein [Bacteroidota bacterium]